MPSSESANRHYAPLTYLLVFVAGLALWLGCRVLLYRYVHLADRALWQSKSAMIKGYSYAPGDVIVVGSSRALAVNPAQVRRESGAKIWNFSVGGATTPSVYFFLKRLLEANPGIPKVYLEFAPMNLTRQDTSLDASLGENFLRHVATLAEARELDADLPGSLDKYRSIKEFPFSGYVNLKDVTLLEKTVIRWRCGENDADLKRRVSGEAGFFLYPHHVISGAAEDRAFEKKEQDYYRKISSYSEALPPVTELYFNKILELLNKRGVDYVIFFSPMPKGALKHQHLAFGGTYRMFRSAGTKVNDRVLLLDNRLFSEPSHVNRQGSEVYTRFFSQCVLKDQCGEFNTANLFERGDD